MVAVQLGDSFCPFFSSFLEMKMKQGINNEKSIHVKMKKLFDFLKNEKSFKSLDETFFDEGRKELMEDFFTFAKKKIKENTLMQYLSTLRSFFSYCLQLDGVKTDSVRTKHLKEISLLLEAKQKKIYQEDNKRKAEEEKSEGEQPNKKQKMEERTEKAKKPKKKKEKVILPKDVKIMKLNFLEFKFNTKIREKKSR